MSKSKKNKALSPDQEFLEQLVVGISEVAHMTAVPIRKIRYWEEKQIIDSINKEEGKNRRYDYYNIKKIFLIKELLNEGYTLEASADKLKKRINAAEEPQTKQKK